MPYAADGMIAEDQFDGSIEITDAQYAEALEGMMEGLCVTIGTGFKVAPPEPPPVLQEPEPTPEQLTAAAKTQRDSLLAVASLHIAPLQDAVDLGSATAADIASLTLWKQYRVAVNRVSEQPGFPATINWPAPPA